MIKVDNLSKYYGNMKAVQSISFELNDGEVVGFLGANGAGKSTTLKVMTGYLSATSGNVYVNDLNIQEHTHKIQKQIDATKPDSLDDKHPVSTSGAKSMPSNKNNIPEVQHDTDLSSQKNLNDVESGNSSETSVPKKGWWQRIIE